MNPHNGFILSIILMLNFSDLPNYESQHCESMKLRVDVSPALDGGSTLRLHVPNDADVRVLLLASSPGSLPKELQLIQGELRNVAKGTYDVIVQDRSKKYCAELQKITVN